MPKALKCHFFCFHVRAVLNCSDIYLNNTVGNINISVLRFLKTFRQDGRKKKNHKAKLHFGKKIFTLEICKEKSFLAGTINIFLKCRYNI